MKSIKFMLSGLMLVLLACFTILMTDCTSIISVLLCIAGITLFIIGLIIPPDNCEYEDDENMP